MHKIFKLGMYTFLSMALAMGVTGCSSDDPDHKDVVPPTVEVSHSVSGRVTSMDGTALVATVTMNGTSKQTNEDGTFVFDNVAAGNYTLKAEADGKLSKETTVTVAESGTGANVVWDVALANEGKTIQVSTTEDTEASVTSETVKGNEDAAVTVDVTVPETSKLPEGSSIVITPIYSKNDGEEMTRAADPTTESMVLVGTNIECSDANATLQDPITLSYDVDAEMAKAIKVQKYVDGQWVDADYTVNGGQVTVFADQFTSYALMFNASLTTTTGSEALEFEKDLWSNLYGYKNMTVSDAAFTYHIGTEITTTGTDQVTAYLIEIMARLAGASVVTAEGSYPLNVTLPTGTALQISGVQQVSTLTLSALNRSVSGKQYGDIAVTTKTYNRTHTGGSNDM